MDGPLYDYQWGSCKVPSYAPVPFDQFQCGWIEGPDDIRRVVYPVEQYLPVRRDGGHHQRLWVPGHEERAGQRRGAQFSARC